MSIKTFIINLDKDIDRWENVKKELKDTDLTYQRFSATLGKDVSDEEKSKNLKGNSFLRSIMTNFMIGCAISHIKLLKHFINKTDYPYILVLEDDFSIKSNVDKKTISQTIKKIINKYDDYHVIRLQYFKILNSKFSNMAYIINREGAKKILKRRINYHIDMEFNLMKDLKIYNHNPQLFEDRGNFVSNNTGKNEINTFNRFLNFDAFVIKVKHIIYFILFVICLILFKKYIICSNRRETNLNG